MRTRYSLINVVTSIFFSLLVGLLSMVKLKLFVSVYGNEINGFFSLTTTIGTAITFVESGLGAIFVQKLFALLASDDKQKIVNLYRTIQKISYFVALGIFLIALVYSFFHVKRYGYLLGEIKVIIAYWLYMVPLIASNILSIPSFLLIADQHGYARSFVSETVNSISFIIQIIIMLLFPQFDVLVISLIMFVCSLGGNVLNYLLAIKHYPYIKTINPTTDYFQWDVPQKMSQSLGASIANSVMTSVDTFMLAYCCPTTSSESLTLISVLTLYNGCISMVKNMLSNMLKQLTSSFGNLYVTCRQRFRNIFYSYLKICLLLLISVFITVNVVITRFIALFYDTNLLLSTVFVIVIVLNALLEVLQVPLLMLPVDICGNYGYKGKVMTFEAIGNVVLSYILLYIMGPIGLFVATLIIQVLVCIIIIPVTMVKYLEDSLKQYVAIILYFSVIYLMDGIILNWIFNLININSILLWFIASGLLLILCVAVNSFISFLVYPDLFSVFKNILFTIFRRPIE